jgi:hypothetical protein
LEIDYREVLYPFNTLSVNLALHEKGRRKIRQRQSKVSVSLLLDVTNKKTKVTVIRKNSYIRKLRTTDIIKKIKEKPNMAH